MSQTTSSPLDPHKAEIIQWVAEGYSNREIEGALAQLGIPSSDRSLRRAFKRWEVERGKVTKPEPASASVRGDTADITSEVSGELNTPDDLMTERGLDPEEWEVVSMTINEWDGPVKGGGAQALKQLKIHLRRVIPLELITPARIDGPTWEPSFANIKKTTKRNQSSRKVVFCGDQQAPYFNEELHESFCDFLFDWEPDEGVLIGDTIDLPDISRHPNTPEKDVSTQECIDVGYQILREYREAYEPIYWRKLAGNHDERLRRLQIDKVERIFGLRRAQVPGALEELPALDVGHLLRLDELGIEYIRPDGDYEHTQINLSDHLAARHGWIARKGSGASALATLEQLGFSVVVGHTHRQSLVHKTRHDINGQLSTLAACETGCMCRVEGGLGYAVAPDWQNGFATAEIWPDGTFKLDLATFVDGTLYYRDKRY